MSCYISSNNNRFYAALETEFGKAAGISGSDRIPAIRLAVRHEIEAPERWDKTGGRTFVGLPGGFRRRTGFELETLLSGWTDTAREPSYGPLFAAALGGTTAFFGGGTVQSMTSPTELVFAAEHGLAAGQAVQCGGEIRFTAAVVDTQAIVLNAPFTRTPTTGTPIGPTVTYLPGTELPSVTIYDYWDPAEAVQRILTGCGIDQLRVDVNGDFHRFGFRGVAGDLVDSGSFVTGQASLTEFPAEPTATDTNYSLVPGNLGQAWLGSEPTQFFSVLAAEVIVDNGLETRAREFGFQTPQCLVGGRRSVLMNFRLYANTRPESTALYQAARQRSPIGVMLQLGDQEGHLCGVHMKSVVPAVPEFDDVENRLQWRFSNCRAQGTMNDELTVAFG